MSLRDDLEELRELLAASWTPAGCLTAEGKASAPLDPETTSWNVVGACMKVSGGELARRQAMIGALRDANLPEGIVKFDSRPGRTLEEVLALVAKARDAA